MTGIYLCVYGAIIRSDKQDCLRMTSKQLGDTSLVMISPWRCLWGHLSSRGVKHAFQGCSVHTLCLGGWAAGSHDQKMLQKSKGIRSNKLYLQSTWSNKETFHKMSSYQICHLYNGDSEIAPSKEMSSDSWVPVNRHNCAGLKGRKKREVEISISVGRDRPAGLGWGHVIHVWQQNSFYDWLVHE